MIKSNNKIRRRKIIISLKDIKFFMDEILNNKYPNRKLIKDLKSYNKQVNNK